MPLSEAAENALDAFVAAYAAGASPADLCRIPLGGIFTSLPQGPFGACTSLARALTARFLADGQAASASLAHPLLAAERVSWADGVLFILNTHEVSTEEIICAHQGCKPLYWLSSGGIRLLRPASENSVNRALPLRFTREQQTARTELLKLYTRLTPVTVQAPQPLAGLPRWRPTTSARLEQLEKLLTCTSVPQIPPRYMNVYHALCGAGLVVLATALLWNEIAGEWHDILGARLTARREIMRRFPGLLGPHCPRLPTSSI